MKREDRRRRVIGNPVERRPTPGQVAGRVLSPEDDALRALQNDPGPEGKRFRRFMRSDPGSSQFSLLDHSFLHLPSDGKPGFLLICSPFLAPAPQKED